MGGRVHGFLGGVLFTSALTYYTRDYFDKNQKFISNSLTTSNHIITDRILSDKERSAIIIAEDKSIAVTKRMGTIETSKDIWNEEVISFANWIYSINWYQWGLKTDRKIHELTDRIASSVVEKK